MSDEELDVAGAIARLNAALSLQYRSVLQYTLAGGTMLGYRHQYLAERLGKCAEAVGRRPSPDREDHSPWR